MAPASWIGTRRSPSNQAASATPTTGSNSMRMPARVPPMRRTPLRNAMDGIAAVKMPGEGEQGQDRGCLDRKGQRLGPAAEHGQEGRTDDRHEQHQRHRLLAGDRAVAVAADHDEDGLAHGRAERQRDPERFEVGCRVSGRAVTPRPPPCRAGRAPARPPAADRAGRVRARRSPPPPSRGRCRRPGARAPR